MPVTGLDWPIYGAVFSAVVLAPSILARGPEAEEETSESKDAEAAKDRLMLAAARNAASSSTATTTQDDSALPVPAAMSLETHNELWKVSVVSPSTHGSAGPKRLLQNRSSSPLGRRRLFSSPRRTNMQPLEC